MTTHDRQKPLSVVVVTLAGEGYLPRCLGALEKQAGARPAEIIVPCDGRISDVRTLRTAFPDVTFLELGGRRTYAELRAAGFRHARGQVIALTEDHCSPDPGWCAAIMRALEGPWAAVGGPVDKQGPDTALNWAIYLCDFSRYMNPVPEGPASYLTDCNVSYRRESIEPLRHLWEDEFHETTVNWALLDRGERLLLSRDVIVRQQRSLGLGPALRERYAFGRLFASTRVAAASPAQRAFYAAFSAALPALLVGRVVKNVLLRRRNVGRLVQALPLVALTATVWAAGEVAGYITGRAAAELAPEDLRSGGADERQMPAAAP